MAGRGVWPVALDNGLGLFVTGIDLGLKEQLVVLQYAQYHLLKICCYFVGESTVLPEWCSAEPFN